MNTRKDFIHAAEIIAAIDDVLVRGTTTTAFVLFFQNDNPRFDTGRFLVRIESERMAGLKYPLTLEASV